jgi:protoheme IX farnesyltransferase
MNPGCRRIELLFARSVSVFNSLCSWVRPWLQLTKAPLCLPVACSAGFGSFLHRPEINESLVLMMLGVLALACGAAAGNSLQEISIDRLYARTRHRPLVTGRLGGIQALITCGLLVTLGLGLLVLATSGYLPLLCGIVALVAYNGLYTPLKQVSAFALLPGGLAGSLPPLIGWTAAGGALVTVESWLLFSLFFLWQIPHFLLVLLHHRQDYQKVGRPCLIGQLSESGTRRIFLVWLLSLITVTLAFPLLLPQLVLPSKALFLAMAGCFFGLGVLIRFGKNSGGQGHFFLFFNACFFVTLVLVMAVQLWWKKIPVY